MRGREREEELLRLLVERADGGREVRISQGELAFLLGLRPQTVSKLLLQLEAERRIRITRTGRANVYTLLGMKPDGKRENQVLPEVYLPNNRAAFSGVFGKCTEGAAGNHPQLLGGSSRRPAPGIPDVRFGKPPTGAKGPPPLALGRSTELRMLVESIQRGASVLMVGEPGVGKTTLLRAFCALAERELGGVKPLYVPQGSPTKEFLVALAWELVGRGLLEEQGFERMRNAQLASLCWQALKCSSEWWVLVLDHCEKLNSTQQGLLEPFLMEWPCVLATSKPKTLRWSHFQTLQLEPLDEFTQEALIGLFIEEEGLWVEDLPLLKKALIRSAKGNAKKLMGLLERCRIERHLPALWVHKELGFEKERDYIDVTPVILIGAAVFIGVRFFGLGFGDRELYVLAGLGYAFAWVFRALMWRWRKPKRSGAS